MIDLALARRRVRALFHHDRRGRLTGVWAARVRALGAVPFYSTSWTNAGWRGVARRLGLELAGVDFQIA